MTPALEIRDSLGPLLAWMTAHAGFPRSRLPVKAEALLCVAALAGAGAGGGKAPSPRGAAMYDRAALRAHTLNRAHAQFKTDNRTKV